MGKVSRFLRELTQTEAQTSGSGEGGLLPALGFHSHTPHHSTTQHSVLECEEFTSLPTDVGFGHTICFGQCNVGKSASSKLRA